jgi:hypothetical protein
MMTKHEQVFYQELETLRYPDDIQRIEHIRHSLAAIRYKRMQKRWFRPAKKVPVERCCCVDSMTVRQLGM